MKNIFKGKKAIVVILTIFISSAWVIAHNSLDKSKVAQSQNSQETKTAQTEQSSVLSETIVSQTSPAPREVPSKGKKAQVVKVVDGDTVTVSFDGKNETIRIIGINTPETVDPRKPVECFGQKASEHAKELLNGKSVQLEPDTTQAELDKYNRLLRYIWLEDGTVDFGATMIAEGLAYEYTYNTPYTYQAKYKQLQKEAEREKKGLWADDACPTQTNTTTATGSTIIQNKTKSSGSSSSEDKDCPDFKTHSEAQAYFNTKGGSPNNNVDNLDADHDGIACETLP